MYGPILLLLSLHAINAVPVDNGVEGDPEITCGDTFIGANFATRNPFEGHIFVKGRFAEPECRIGPSNSQNAEIKLDFSSCGVKRTRSANPKGVFVSATIIITFHPQFITKVDKAYMIQCYYMEADKTVTTEIEVSMLTTSLHTQTVLMPICRYEVLKGGPDGPPIRFAQIGEQVYHKWTCDTETVDIFCMLVHSCKVDDGAGDIIPLVDDTGCSLDVYLLGNLEYPMDLMAGKEAHVFKYADRPNLYFDCQITITVKDPGVPCAFPQCAERRKRSGHSDRVRGIPFLDNEHTSTQEVVDVDVDPITVVDLSRDDLTKDFNEFEKRYDESYSREPVNPDDICMSLLSFSAYTVLNVLLMVSALAMLVSSCRSSPKSVQF